MKENAAVHGFANRWKGPSSLVLVGVVAVLLICFGGTAAAAGPIGKDGQIHACYRVKGKPKGELRVVRSARAHCRRGERKTSWSLAGSAGLAGTGSAGSAGGQGTAGQSAAAGSSDEAALKAQVGALSARVETLEGVLDGVTNGALLGAIAAVPAVESLCDQSTALTKTANELGAGLGALVSVLKGTVLGSIFGGVGVPGELSAFSCPTF